MIAEPGVYEVTAEDYHADRVCPQPSLSSSGARKLMQEPPAKFWHKRNNPSPPTDALVFGSAAHEWLLEGETWPLRHFVLPDDCNGRTKAGKELVAKVEADGLRAITHDDMETIRGMKGAIEAHPYAMAAFENGSAETSLYWRDIHADIWCRARPDFLPARGRIFADYKTTTSLRTDDLQRAIAKYGYHMQASWYSDAIRAVGLAEHPIMLFVFQEKTPPWLVRCVTIGEQSLMWAEAQNAMARDIFARCLRSGRWPGYEEEIVTLDMPSWELARIERASEAGEFTIEDMRSAA